MGAKDYFRNMGMGIRRWFGRKLRERRLARMYVILDARDNSVTMSRELCRHIGVDDLEQAKVFVFSIAGSDACGERKCEAGGEDGAGLGDKVYGFCVNPDVGEDAPLADIQYNSKYHCIGFESLVPTVNRILYDYQMPAGIRARLSVEHRTAPGLDYYIIHRPCRTS